MKKPIIGIPLGDPAGIGPEITIKTFDDKETTDICNLLLVGDKYVVEKALKITGINMNINVIDKVEDAKFEETIGIESM